jgi:hypothetical protein
MKDVPFDPMPMFDGSIAYTARGTRNHSGGNRTTNFGSGFSPLPATRL